MVFFKKNKKSAANKIAPIDDAPFELSDIIPMDDQVLTLDDQIEQLTSELNLSPEDDLQPNVEAVVATENPLVTADKSPKASIDQETEKSESKTPTTKSETPKAKIKTPDNETAKKKTKVKKSAPATNNKKDNDDDTDISEFQLETSSFSQTQSNITEIRTDVTRISADIQGGDELYRRALQRIEGLMVQVERAEVDFSVLNRLEPENRRLKARLRTNQSELESNKNKLNLVSTDLEDHRVRLDEKTAQFEEVRSKLVITTKTLREYDRRLKDAKADLERHTLAMERNKTALSVEHRENKALREKISELSEAVEARQLEYLEASKLAESLKVDFEDQRKQADVYRGEAQDFRVALNTAKRQNNIMKGEMLTLHDEIKAFKTQYEFNVIDREDQVTNLEAKIATLGQELDAKKDAAEKREVEFSNLRRARAQQEIERDRLEKSIDELKAELIDIKRLKTNEMSEQVLLYKRDILGLETDLKKRDEIAERSRNEAEAIKRQLTSANLERESLQTQYDIQTQELESLKQEDFVGELNTTIDKLTSEAETARSQLTTANMEREKLQTEIDSLKRTIEDSSQDAYINDLKAQLETVVAQSETARQQLTSANVEREKLQSELDNQKRELEEISSQNPAETLQEKVDALTEQLRIKDEIVQSAAHDVSQLREERERQASEYKRLEEKIHSQTYQLEVAQKALLESKQNETELDQRYKDVAAALSVNNTRRQTETPSLSPDIKPDISDEHDQTHEDIEQRILDYKFGIIEKLT